MTKHFVICCGWLMAIYAAIVLQTGWPEFSRPVLPAIVAATALSICSRSSGLLWCALAGLSVDAAGYGRIGLHLMCYTVLGATALACVPDGHRRWDVVTVLMAGLLSGGDELVVRIVTKMTHHRTFELNEAAIEAFNGAAYTTGAVLILVIARWMLRRRLQSPEVNSSVRLANRWRMLTE